MSQAYGFLGRLPALAFVFLEDFTFFGVGFDRDSIFLAFLDWALALAAVPLQNRDDWAPCLPCPEVFFAFDLGDSYPRHRVRHACLCVIDC